MVALWNLYSFLKIKWYLVKDNFTSSFLICIPLFFSCLISLVKIFRKMFSRNNATGHPCLISNILIAFSLSIHTSEYKVSCELFI
jgi:hypothetical protein